MGNKRMKKRESNAGKSNRVVKPNAMVHIVTKKHFWTNSELVSSFRYGNK